jgi:MFS family permease
LFLQGLLGPFLAGFVALIVGFATTVQWNGVFFVYLVAFPIWAMMFVWLFEPKKAAEKGMTIAAEIETPKGPFPAINLVMIASVTLFSSMLYYVFIINGALVFREVGVTEPQNYAALIFIPQFFILAGAAIFRLISGLRYAVQIGAFLALMGLGLAGIGLATTPMMMAAALVVQQTAAGMAVPTLINWTQSKFDYHHRGTGMGVWTAAFFLGQSQSPRLVHFVDAELGSMQGAFLFAGGVALGGAALAGLLSMIARRQMAQA